MVINFKFIGLLFIFLSPVQTLLVSLRQIFNLFVFIFFIPKTNKKI